MDLSLLRTLTREPKLLTLNTPATPGPLTSPNAYLCAKAADVEQMCGVKAPGQDAGSGRQRKRYMQDDLRRKA